MWTPDSPSLYTAKLTVKENDKVVDQIEESFGIRTIGYNAVNGFTLNGKPLDKPFIGHDELMAGGELVLKMGDRPDKEWGK